MNSKILIVLLLVAAVATASWIYKGQEFQDNQVVVYITGASLTPAEVEAGQEAIPELQAGKEIEVQVNGELAHCQLSSFDRDSRAIGTVDNGRLENAVAMPLDGPYSFVGYGDDRATKELNRYWGTTEMVNTLEVAGCAVLKKTGSRIQVNDISAPNGGSLVPAHTSHRRGLDADIRLVCSDGTRIYPCQEGGKFYAAGSWAFVKALAVKTPVQRIFLDQRLINQLKIYADANERDYVLKQKIFARLLSHVHGHYNHFHVRIHCSPRDPQCIDQPGGFRGTGNEAPFTEEEYNLVYTLNVSDDALLAKADADPNKCLYFDEDLDPIISYCSQKYGISECLIKAVMTAESGSGCGKRGGKPRDVSSANAIGLMQITQSAAEGQNKRRAPEEQLVFPDDLYKPSKNICAGSQELAAYWDPRIYRNSRYNIQSVEDILKAYNAGIGKFVRNEIPPKTLDYIEKIKRYHFEICGVAFNNDSPEAPGINANGWGYS